MLALPWLLGLCAALAGLLALLYRLIFRSQSSSVPGVSNEEFLALFSTLREDAFLLLARRFSSLTIMHGAVLSTAEPATVRALVQSRAHSLGRSAVYRFMAFLLPASDGMLFAADEEWKRRHSLFTSLFTASHVQGLLAAGAEGAARICGAAAARREASAPITELPQAVCLSSALPDILTALEEDAPLGCDELSQRDLLTLVRNSAAHVFLAWTLGVSPDHKEALTMARLLDAYARVCFDVMPYLARGLSEPMPLSQKWQHAVAWIRCYRTLVGLSARLRTSVEWLRGSCSEALACSPQPSDSFLSRMCAAKWSAQAMTSELNHLHGAHKAIALVTCCALAELSAYPRLRAELREELVARCGAPPYQLSAQALAEGMRSNSAAHAAGEAPAWRPPCKADLDSGLLPLLAMVWRETLRRHVVSMGTLRKLGEDFHGAKAGTDALLLLHTMHHEEGLWGEDAHFWEPRRWDPSSEYWVKRVAANPDDSRRFQSTNPAGVFVPAAQAGAHLPFLDGLRRCAGQALAELEFASMLYAFLVPFTISITLPSPSPTPLPPTGGGTAVLPRASVLGRLGAVALVHDASAPPWSSRSVMDEDAVSSGKALEGRLRLHLVRAADMFTVLEGKIHFTVGRAQERRI
jgi:cytochrome P450